MRRTLAASILLALATAGCGSLQTYRDLPHLVAPALHASPPAPEVDALVARFYANGSVPPKEIEAAVAAWPKHAAIREIAGYSAVLRGDSHAAFEHFMTALADTSAVSPELYAFEMRERMSTVSEHVLAGSLLRDVAWLHPRPLVRQLAAYELARDKRLVGEIEAAEALIATLGFIDAWEVVGAFDNDQNKGFSTVYPPEESADRTKAYQGMRLPARFRPLATRAIDGALPLGDAIFPREDVVAYAETTITVDRPMTVDLRLTTTNGVRVFVGGKLAASDEKIFREELDNVIVRVSLSRGENRILVKSAHQSGPWRLAARFTDPATGRVLALRAARSGTSLGAGSGKLVSPMGAIERLSDPNRKRFLLARAWTREGHTRRAPHYLDPLRKDVPKNPLVAYFSARSLREAGEAGQAIDLLNTGIAKLGGAPAFVIERARFYAQRKLWDKAQRDLEAALALSPDARDAAFELASVHGARGWTADRCKRLAAIVERWPDDLRALHDLGICHEQQQYFEEAERMARRANALAPGYLPALDRLVWLTERRLDHGGSERWSKERSLVWPMSYEHLLDEAELHRRSGRTALQMEALERARSLSPDAPTPYERLAYVALEQGKRDEAALSFRQALERDPDNASLAQRVAAMSPDSLGPGDRMVVSAEEIDRVIRAGEAVAVHPGSHYVVLLDEEITTVGLDGSQKRVSTTIARAVDNDGRDALIQARLPKSGRVTVREAYSVKKDGERQEAASMSGGVVRFRALDVGSTAVLQYVHYAPPSRFLPNELYAEQRFQRVSAQVEAARWSLVMPKDRALQVAVRGAVEQKREIVGAQTIWSFTAKSAPPLVPEPHMPPASEALWAATVSTVKDWDAFVKWDLSLLSDAFSTSADLDALAKKLTSDAATPREKLNRLWAYVAQEIRYQQDYEDTIAGVRPHSANMVRERGYGDCKDKAVLLMRLAKTVGVDTRFALLRTRPFGKIVASIPNQQFNHAIVYVPRQAGIDEPLFVDTTTNGLDVGNTPSDDEGALSLVADPATGKWEMIPIPHQPPELEYVKHQFEVSLADPKRATAKDHYEARGTPGATLRVSVRSKEGAKKHFQSVADRLFGGALVTKGEALHAEDITKPAEAKLEIDLSGSIHEEDGAYRLDLPLTFPYAGAVSLAERAQPLLLSRGTQSFELVAEIGEGHVAAPPADFSVEHACFQVSRKSEVKGRRVTVRASFKATCPEIAPADYPAFRAAVQKAGSHTKDKLVFGPKAKVKR